MRCLFFIITCQYVVWSWMHCHIRYSVKKSEKAKADKRLPKYADDVPKETKIVPTVTLVLYYGDTSWDGPLSVYDMLDIPEEMKAWAKYGCNIGPSYSGRIKKAEAQGKKGRGPGDKSELMSLAQKWKNQEEPLSF